MPRLLKIKFSLLAGCLLSGVLFSCTKTGSAPFRAQLLTAHKWKMVAWNTDPGFSYSLSGFNQINTNLFTVFTELNNPCLLEQTFEFKQGGQYVYQQGSSCTNGVKQDNKVWEFFENNGNIVIYVYNPLDKSTLQVFKIITLTETELQLQSAEAVNGGTRLYTNIKKFNVSQ